MIPRIVFYTATYRLTEARALASSCGVAAVISKPSDPQAILDVVAHTLGAEARAIPSTTKFSGLAGTRPPSHPQELADLQQRLQRAVDQGLALLGENDSRQQTSGSLVQPFQVVGALSMRLAAALELGLVLCSERTPQRLLDLFCGAAQNIMGCERVVVGILAPDSRRLESWASHGLSGEAHASFATIDPCAGILGEVLTANEPLHVHNLNDSVVSLGLPSAHPLVKIILALPLRSATTTHGWLYFAEKSNSSPFDEEDEQFAVTLAAQLAVAYGNLALYDDVQRRAVALELEVAERKKIVG